MSEPPTTSEDLIREFKNISRAYQELREKHDLEVSRMLRRRREIILMLKRANLTHKEIGLELGLSTGRVGQLVREAPGYVTAS